MTTMEIPTFRSWLAWKLRNPARPRVIRTQSRVPALLAFWYSLSKLVLHVAGFSLLTWAGFSFNMPAGLITAGLSCFVLSWLQRSPASQSDQ